MVQHTTMFVATMLVVVFAVGETALAQNGEPLQVHGINRLSAIQLAIKGDPTEVASVGVGAGAGWVIAGPGVPANVGVSLVPSGATQFVTLWATLNSVLDPSGILANSQTITPGTFSYVPTGSTNGRNLDTDLTISARFVMHVPNAATTANTGQQIVTTASQIVTSVTILNPAGANILAGNFLFNTVSTGTVSIIAGSNYIHLTNVVNT